MSISAAAAVRRGEGAFVFPSLETKRLEVFSHLLLAYLEEGAFCEEAVNTSSEKEDTLLPSGCRTP